MKRPRRSRTGRRLVVEPLQERRLLAGLVGVDFDAAGGSAPSNWTLIDGFTPATNVRGNLPDEGGEATSIALTLSLSVPSGGGDGEATNPLDVDVLPRHNQSLAGLDGTLVPEFISSDIIAEWSGLDGGTAYRVYVFGAEQPDVTSNPTITIQGAGDAVQFPQLINDNFLQVNRAPGDSARSLASFAETVVADSSGRITITLEPGANNLVSLAALAIEPPKAPIIVNSTADVDDNNSTNGVTTLREAARLANDQPDQDTIQFDPATNGQTFTLTQGELLLTEDVVIEGQGAGQTVIDAAGNSGVISFGAQITEAELRDLTVRGAPAGERGIRVFDMVLMLDGVEVTGNLGGGVSVVSADLELTDSTVTANSTSAPGGSGGGIFANNANLLLTDSTVSGNSTSGTVASGGGIAASNTTIEMLRSTISGNSTSGGSSPGGGMFGDTVGFTAINSTISGNMTTGDGSNGGGLAASGSGVALTNTTVTANSVGGAGAAGGGLHTQVEFDLSVLNTIVAGNTAPANPDLQFSLMSAANSLFGDFAGNSGATFNDDGGNQIGNSEGGGSTIDGELAPLADNGGATETHVPALTSPAINGGDNSLAVDFAGEPLTGDQRGNSRFIAAVDIGSVERNTWHNVDNPEDVNGDTIVDVQDLRTVFAFLIVNNPSPLSPAGPPSAGLMVDVIPDSFIAVDDVRQVFARILVQAGGGEAEAEPQGWAAPLDDPFDDEEEWWLA